MLKYHRRISTYLKVLLKATLKIAEIKELTSNAEILRNTPKMQDELRGPMMLQISVEKV